MDNRIFNVNGKTKKQLDLAVQMFMLTEYGDYRRIDGYYFSEEYGLVLTCHVKDGKSKPFTNSFGEPTPITDPETLSKLLWDWLSSDEAKTVKVEGWDSNADHDGENDKGWRLYTGDWGCITTTDYSVGAFKPAWLWYGK